MHERGPGLRQHGGCSEAKEGKRTGRYKLGASFRWGFLRHSRTAQPAVFISGIILLLNVWSGKRTGLVPDPSREIANVHKCMEVVRLCDDR